MLALIPKYSHTKSFYNKALINMEENKITLYSYGTRVCELDKNGNVVFIELHSHTTSRHIKEFLKQFSNLPGEWFKLPMKNIVNKIISMS